jgi:predicted alpha/beta superfamily hydrolase
MATTTAARVVGAAVVAGVCVLAGCAGGEAVAGGGAGTLPGAEPLVIGETFTVDSKVLGERRRVNVYVPTVYGAKIEEPMPVLLMPDGGLDEDFVHIAGLVQVLVSDGTMRAHVLVGIPNTGSASRRRDLTGPTSNPEDRKIAPRVGGSAEFRAFIRDEVMPAVRARYGTMEGDAAIVGESLAGLFVLETMFEEPRMFRTYIAVDPSLWWSNGALVSEAAARLAAPEMRGALDGARVFVATGGDAGLDESVERLGAAVAGASPAAGRVWWRHEAMAGETHATIYHPAALAAFRAVMGVERK